MEIEMKLTTRDKSETEVLADYSGNPKECTIETEDYVFDGNIVMTDLWEDMCVYEAKMNLLFYGDMENKEKKRFYIESEGIKITNYNLSKESYSNPEGPYIEFFVTREYYDKIKCPLPKESYNISPEPLQDAFETHMESIAKNYLDFKSVNANIIGYEKEKSYKPSGDIGVLDGYTVKIILDIPPVPVKSNNE